MKRFPIVCALVAVVSLGALAVQAQVKQGKTRPIKTKQLMKGLVAANCGAIGEALKSPPTDDKGWDELATKAALLNEASYTLMDDGRCPDAAWADADKMLREGSATLLSKLEAKDAAGAQEAFKTMTQACGACHKAHKK
jgi:cytochrome c556